MFIGIDDPCSDSKNIFDHIDLEDDLQWNYTLLNCPTAEFLLSSSDFDLTQDSLSTKSQIRNHDCMWSGRCTTHPEKLQCNGGLLSKHLQQKTQQMELMQQHSKNMLNTIESAASISTTTQQQIKKHSIGQEQIPAGRSLLINSRLNQVKPTAMAIKLPTVTTNDFLKEREFIARPDTPLSLDDDPPEFKHSIDLAACTMGSNKMSLIENEHETIIKLKEHLEDHTSSSINLKNKFIQYDSKNELTYLLKDLKSFSDFEDNDDDESCGEEMDSENESSINVTTSAHQQEQEQQQSQSPSPTSSAASSPSSASQSSNYEYNQTMHSDHSYTRSKNRVDVCGLGVQTPSDSGKLIFFLICIFF